MAIISFQSRVVWGSVGNAVAVPALQALGHDVWPVDTVVFSNHPGRGRFTGRVTPATESRALLDGLEAQGGLEICEAVISGYLGSPESAEIAADAVRRVRRARPGTLFVCDPVMGSPDKGLYVDPGIPAAITERLLPLADVLTPNRFELATLTGGAAAGAEDVAAARDLARELVARMNPAGRGLVVVKSMTRAPNRTGLMWLTRMDGCLLTTERIHDNFNGSGDLLAALLSASLLSERSIDEALARALRLLMSVLKQKGGAPEIPLSRIARALTHFHDDVEMHGI